MTDILTDARNRRYEAEWKFAAACFQRFDLAREFLWISPQMFLLEELRRYWDKAITTQDFLQAAVECNVTLELTRPDYQIVPWTNSLTPFYSDMVRKIWMYETAVKLPRIFNAIAGDDTEATRKLVQELSAMPPETAPSLPDVGDIHLEFLESGESSGTIRVGMPKFDKATGGLWRGALTVLCARPGVGKTAAALQMARGVGVTKHVLFRSLEMKSRELWGRMACGAVKQSYQAWISKELSEQAKRQIIDKSVELMEIYNGKLLFDDAPGDTGSLWQTAMAIKPDLIICDHLALFDDKDEREVRRLGKITWSLKKLAKEFDIPVLALAQLNRKLEDRTDKHPTLADLRDSGEIEQNADMVIGLHRDRDDVEEKPKAKSRCDWDILKFRNGSTDCRMIFDFIGLEQWFYDPKEW